MIKTITKIIMLAVIGLSHVTNAQSPNFQWTKTMGGTGHDYGTSITTDTFGNVYTTGTFSGTVDFDPGFGTFNLTSAGVMAIFVSKLDSSGNFVWAKQFSGTNGVKAASASITIDASGNVYTTGHFQGTYDFNPGAGTFNLSSSQRGIFISKLDSSGNFVWAKRMSGTYDSYGYSIALDALGNIYTTGSFTLTVDFDPGAGTFNMTAPGLTPFNGNPPSEIFISKLDNAGNFIWAKQMGGTSDDYAMSITIDNGGSGAIYTTGSFRKTADFDPGTGVFNLIGPVGGPQFPVSDIFVSKLDTAGNFMWAKHLGEAGGERGYSIATDAFGNVYTTGTFVGTSDFDPDSLVTFNLTSAGGLDIFISKLNSSGNFVFAKSAGGTGYDYGVSIAVDASSNVYATGYFRSPSIMAGSTILTNAGTGNTSDIFFAKLDNSGNFVWAKAVGGTSHDYGQSIILDVSGSVLVAGYFRSPTIMFDATTFTNADNSGNTSDLFIAKLDTAVVTGNNEIENFYNRILLFPNPATNHLTIELPNSNKKVEVTIADITGKIVYKTFELAAQKIEVNTEDFEAGVYLVQVQSAAKLQTEKLIITK